MAKTCVSEFCFIAPISHLQYTTSSQTHLTLAHLVNDSNEYASFYKKQSALGSYIIMDNSAYELKEPYDTNKLITLGHECGANAIVLPDYPFQHSSVTIKAAQKYAKCFKDAGFDVFFVPQSKVNELDDWLYAYEWATDNPLIDIIGMSILGIPNAIPYIPPSYARVVMTQIIQDAGIFDPSKHHHYLGLNSGPALEIPALLKMGALDSIDSSGPIWAAILGHAYTTEADSLQQVAKLKMPVNFYCPETKDPATIARIENNIRLTDDLFDIKSEVAPWYAQE